MEEVSKPSVPKRTKQSTKWVVCIFMEWIEKKPILRTGGTTSLFSVGVPEAVIQKRTGHKSQPATKSPLALKPLKKNSSNQP